jgi:hypothetical protein
MCVTRSFFLAGLLSAALSGHVQAQDTTPSEPPCSDDIHGHFDFWLGEWNVYSPDNGPYQGQNSIIKTNGDCLITEQWLGASGTTGDSMNFYDPLEEKWRQIWVSGGAFIDYVGGLDEGGAMILNGEIAYPGNPARFGFKGTWSLQSDGSVRQHFEQQDTEGNWSNWFIGIYVRKSTDPRAEEASAARGE